MHKLQLKSWRIFLIGFLLLLSACSTVRKDGPPPFDVDVAKIPDATPKQEKLSKYGNYSAYHVFGKTYHVMSSSKNYEERGIASWYGTKFHAQRTSSGERYNMLGMTAAHKTLPLPTYVQVTNLKNGKKIIVKVNDRGPFEANRIIDLSYVAAKKLGMLGHGTAYVYVKAIDPARYDKNNFEQPIHSQNFYLASNGVRVIPPAAVKNTERTLHYAQAYAGHHAHQTQDRKVYLQVGAFKNKLLAEHMKKKVNVLFSSTPKMTRLTYYKNLYRVQIGPIKDSVTANHITQQLKTIGLHSHQTIEEV